MSSAGARKSELCLRTSAELTTASQRLCKFRLSLACWLSQALRNSWRCCSCSFGNWLATRLCIALGCLLGGNSLFTPKGVGCPLWKTVFPKRKGPNISFCCGSEGCKWQKRTGHSKHQISQHYQGAIWCGDLGLEISSKR